MNMVDHLQDELAAALVAVQSDVHNLRSDDWIDTMVFDDFVSQPQMSQTQRAAHVAYLIENHPSSDFVATMMGWLNRFNLDQLHISWLRQLHELQQLQPA